MNFFFDRDMTIWENFSYIIKKIIVNLYATKNI